MTKPRRVCMAITLWLVSSLAWAQPRRKVIIDQDCAGPGGSNLQTLLMMIQSPQSKYSGYCGKRDQCATKRSRTRFGCSRSSDVRIYPSCRERSSLSCTGARKLKYVNNGMGESHTPDVGRAVVAEPFVVQPCRRTADHEACGGGRHSFFDSDGAPVSHEVTLYEAAHDRPGARDLHGSAISQLAKELVFMGGS